MVLFHVDEYYSTLDRGYYHKEPNSGTPIEVDFPDVPYNNTQLTPREIGTGLDANVYPMTALNAKIREGVAKVEITFMGAGKGSQGSITPESIGRLEREQIREMAKLNEVKFSTHSTPNMMGVSGFNPRSGTFDDQFQHSQLDEINKAIEFAAEASTGGAIVFHTGEWSRPIFQAGISAEQKAAGVKDNKFRAFDTEMQKSPVYLADEQTGKIMPISRDMKFYFPEEEFDKETQASFIKLNPDGSPKVNEYTYDQAVDHLKKIHSNDGLLKDRKTGQILSDEQIILNGFYEQELKRARGDMMRYMSVVEDSQKKLKKIVEAKQYVKDMWNSTPPEKRDQLLEYVRTVDLPYIPRDAKNPIELFEEAEKNTRRELEGYKSVVVSAQESMKKTQEEMSRMKPIEEVGIKRTTEAIATLGMKAMEATNKHKRELNEPLFISPESFEPDYYGSHPSEIRKIISESRDKMTKMLVQKGLSDQEAKEKAKAHIRGTLDSGHFNMWRKYYQGKPEDYEKWYLNEAEKLAKEGIIGHIHLTDNFGYDDEHLTPGQGNVPLREFMKRMENAGLKDFIVERGSFNGPTALPDTLAEIGSPIYSLDKSRRFTFGNLNRGHFGYTTPPNYIVGAYVPSEEWRFWSNVPLE